MSTRFPEAVPLKSWGINPLWRLEHSPAVFWKHFLYEVAASRVTRQGFWWLWHMTISNSGCCVASTWASPEGALKSSDAWAILPTNCTMMCGIGMVIHTFKFLGDSSVAPVDNQVYIVGSQTVVPRPQDHRNLLEMQILRHHPRLSVSETRPINLCFKKVSGNSDACWFENHSSRAEVLRLDRHP